MLFLTKCELNKWWWINWARGVTSTVTRSWSSDFPYTYYYGHPGSLQLNNVRWVPVTKTIHWQWTQIRNYKFIPHDGHKKLPSQLAKQQPHLPVNFEGFSPHRPWLTNAQHLLISCPNLKLFPLQCNFQTDSAVAAATFYHFHGIPTPNSNTQRDTQTNLGLKQQQRGLIWTAW